MMWVTAIGLSLLNVASCLDKTFPPGFRFGAATAAYQIEGGWNASDKGESIWDRLIHSRPEVIAGRATGDVACDSYHNWRRDVEMVQQMGLHFYRFSISWTRILPNAFPTKISESGKKYYNDLINYILEQGIEPVITIYHWDLPQKLQDLGGWTNPLITDWFADYARVVFSLFADRVKTWITINEPNLMCDLNYNIARFAPLIKEPEMAGLLCNKNVLVAHAKAWRIYDKEYKPIYHGKISIANQVLWIGANTAGDEEIAELARQACTGQYAHPIYSKQGGWPPSVEEAMALYSKRAGYPRSKLPAFTKEELLLVRGTYDFFAVNYYTARLARRRRDRDGPAVWFATGHPDLDITLEVDPSWPVRGLSLTPSYPEGLRKNLAWLRKQYGDLEFFVTENGCGDPELNDHVRIDYIKTHLEQILISIKEDGANVTGYTYWTLMDNFEWNEGYEVKFGLYEVDFDDPKRTRRPRASAYYYSQVATALSLTVPPPKELHRHTDYSRPANRSSNTKDYAYVYLLVLCLFNCLIRYSCLVSLGRGVRQFPPGFRFGSASAAYQVEGAWNASDKGESVWDRYAHDHPDIVINGNGDVAADSYHLWKEDVRIAKELGLHFYRFSISWTRIMPSGFPTTISETGRKYYSNLIDGLLESGVEPVVTLYHWDLPQKLQDLGGWTNPLIADWFADYAKVVFSFYADRVKTWITINEPILICDGTYNMQFTAPRIKEPELAPYLCNKHTLIAHAKAWRIYDTEYRRKYHGKVSLTNNLVWMEPLAPMYKDLTELALQHCVGRYAHPIFSKRGGWPPTIEKALAEYSRKQGHVRSRLPAFTKEEIHLIRGTYDFFAMNIYTSRLVRPSLPGDGPRVWFVTGSPELNITLVSDPQWKVGAISIMPAYPKGIRRHIAWLRREYGADLPILITENGYASFKRDLADNDRIEYLKDHLEQVLLSINEDGANVTGYSVWSLTDNFEWMAGYSSRFGLYDVDFEDPRRKRTQRASAHFYADLIKTRRLDTPIHTLISRVRSERHSRRTNSANSCHGLGIIVMILIQIAGSVIVN